MFYQFGKYLTKKPGEPIIDQHVLRAFGIFKADGDKDRIKKLKRLSLITKKEKRLMIFIYGGCYLLVLSTLTILKVIKYQE